MPPATGGLEQQVALRGIRRCEQFGAVLAS
jgi:hypothetical protein